MNELFNNIWVLVGILVVIGLLGRVSLRKLGF